MSAPVAVPVTVMMPAMMRPITGRPRAATVVACAQRKASEQDSTDRDGGTCLGHFVSPDDRAATVGELVMFRAQITPSVEVRHDELPGVIDAVRPLRA
jgi:hypothetical protein